MPGWWNWYTHQPLKLAGEILEGSTPSLGTNFFEFDHMVEFSKHEGNTMRYFEITVQGRGTFPFDMLRFGQLYPVGIEDAHNMDPDCNKMRDITLATDGSYMKEHAIIARLASFGWNGETTKIVDDEHPVFDMSVEMKEG